MIHHFMTPTRIIFGYNAVKELSAILDSFGKQVFLVTGKALHLPPLEEQLLNAGKKPVRFSLVGEPTIHEINKAVHTARTHQTDVVIGIGGGSAIDAAKAVAGLVPNTGELGDYLEVIGNAKPLKVPSLPCIAVPTTAGTGAEVTKNAVVRSTEHNVKVSLRSPLLYPHTAIVDPALAESLPPSISASTGLDALTQCIESFISCKATPFTDILATEGITRALRSLPEVCSNGDNSIARTDLSFAALLSGMALANAGLGAVHGFAAVIGGLCDIPHGIVCAQLLPHVLHATISTVAESADAVSAVTTDKLRTLARLCSTGTTEEPESIMSNLHTLYSTLPLPAAHTVTIDATLFPRILQGARNASSMKGSPVLLNDEKLHAILVQAFG